jgi:hypothetical protein
MNPTTTDPATPERDPAGAGTIPQRSKNLRSAAGGSASSPRTELPHDWQPTTGAQAWIIRTYGFTPRQVADELEAFHDVHAAVGDEQADWSHAWFRYMRSRAYDLGLTP